MKSARHILFTSRYTCGKRREIFVRVCSAYVQSSMLRISPPQHNSIDIDTPTYVADVGSLRECLRVLATVSIVWRKQIYLRAQLHLTSHMALVVKPVALCLSCLIALSLRPYAPCAWLRLVALGCAQPGCARLRPVAPGCAQ